MAKLNQTQRDYFTRRVHSIQTEKRTEFIRQLKTSLPNLNLKPIPINAESIRAGKYRLKTQAEILESIATNGWHNNNPYIKDIAVPVANPDEDAAEDIYKQKLAEYDRLMNIQRRKFNDQIMLGGDETALAALALLEAEVIVIPG